MPWVDNRELASQYWRITWYPNAADMPEALAWADELSLGGFEYGDGIVPQSPFTDIPLAPGRSFVRVYVPLERDAVEGQAVRQYCAERNWPVEQEIVDSVDWANAWKTYYHPQPVAEGYVIVPVWYDESPQDQAHTLWLDPGMAFGTGTHATTRMCLNGLAGLELHDQRVLDLGAGSGILGLFAALCGAARVVMVEPDPVAVDAIAHNAKQNHLEDRIVVVPGTLANLNPEGFDVLCLNLIWEIIAAEWTRVQRYIAQTGSTLLLSGLLAERQDDVKRLVRQTGQRVLAMEESEGWLLVTVRHDSSRA